MDFEMIKEYIGYIASLIVLVSLLMSSIKKLRWINLIGALLFGFYGFAIGSIPTGLMNLGIVIIDVYYLVKMYKSKEYFRILSIDHNSDYLPEFYEFYKKDVQSFTSVSLDAIKNAEYKVFILRNMTPAGIFAGNVVEGSKLDVILDYVIPMYRDFKVGNYVFKNQRSRFLDMGITELIGQTENEAHRKYLVKMGFEESKPGYFTKSI
jgi:hypothetical protein